MLFLDLHGLNVQEAKKAITDIFHKAFEENVESVYIITGRGNHVNANGTSGVLKKLLPSLLKPYAQKIECVDTESGAYKIVLKQEPSLKKKFIDQLAKTDLFQSFQEEQERAAKSGNTDAMIALACLHLSFSRIDETKIKTALATLTQLEKNNNATAGTVLAEIYLEGLCAKREPEKGFRLLKKYAGASMVAKFNLAKCYLLGEGIKRDDTIGAQLMKELADKNDAAACGNLGKSYIAGDFTEVNDKLGFYYLKKAADLGYSYIYVNLARCYGSGQGVKQDDHLALHYYTKAAEINNPFAIHQLGSYYLFGKGVTIDAPKAFKCFLRAANLGDVDSQAQVAVLYFKGLGTDKDYPEGIKWLAKAADQNEIDACFILGEILLSGILTKQDIPLAVKYLKVAIKDNYSYAMFSLALAILKLPHSTQQQDYAFNLLKKAPEYMNDNVKYLCDLSWSRQNFMLAWAFFNPPKDMVAKTAKKDIFFLRLTMLSTGLMQKEMYDPILSLEIATYAAVQGDVASQLYLFSLTADSQKPRTTPPQNNQHIDEKNNTQDTGKPYLSKYALAAITGVTAVVASAVFYQYRK